MADDFIADLEGLGNVSLGTPPFASAPLPSGGGSAGAGDGSLPMFSVPQSRPSLAPGVAGAGVACAGGDLLSAMFTRAATSEGIYKDFQDHDSTRTFVRR